MNITTVGLDLAKNVSHFVGCNQVGKIIKKRMLRRKDILSYFQQLAPCIVGIESCASAHYWAREIEKLGHTVKQISPQYVKAYLRGNKNDYNDGRLKSERVQWKSYQTRQEAQQDILQYITMFYNSIRLHSYLGNKSPNQFENEMREELKNAA